MPPSSKPADSGRPRAPDLVVALVTVPDVATGERIAEALVSERLAACVNRVGPIRSRFRWKGAPDSADEHLLLIKARASALARLEARVRALHPYELPELLALPVAGGSADYLAWLAAESDA